MEFLTELSFLISLGLVGVELESVLSTGIFLKFNLPDNKHNICYYSSLKFGICKKITEEWLYKFSDSCNNIVFLLVNIDWFCVNYDYLEFCMRFSLDK